MSTQDFLILYASVLASMVACRCIPLFVLKGRELSSRLSQALGLIPAASFAALVANDLISPSAFVANPLQAVVPFIAAAVVVVVARKTGSLIWCAIVGMCFSASTQKAPPMRRVSMPSRRSGCSRVGMPSPGVLMGT